jgi:hypothetical protein
MLLRAVRIALDVRLLVGAAVGLGVMLGGWSVCAWLFSGSDEQSVKELTDYFGHGTWAIRAPEPSSESLSAEIPGGPEISSTFYLPGGRWLPFDPFFGSWAALSRPWRLALDPHLSVVGFTFLSLCGLWAVIVWALFGAVISRIAAVKFAREERLTLGRAWSHARSRYGAYLWAPLFPLVGVFLLAIPVALVGWLMAFDAGILLLAIIWPLCLLAAFLMAIFLIGLAFGWPLMWATISVEGTDSFDALSRSYAYVYQRPLHYFGYAVFVAVLGWLAAIVVQLFAFAVVLLSFWAASWTSGHVHTDQVIAQVPTVMTGIQWLDARLLAAASSEQQAEFGPAGRAGIAVLSFWVGCVQFIALGFGLSYFWTAATGIYLLLRSRVDNTELDEVFLEDEVTHYGLPPLEEDEAGVPKVGEEGPLAPQHDAESRIGSHDGPPLAEPKANVGTEQASDPGQGP